MLFRSQEETAEFCACLISNAKSKSERKVRYMLCEDENVQIIQRYAYFGEEIKRYPKNAEEAQRLIARVKAYMK